MTGAGKKSRKPTVEIYLTQEEKVNIKKAAAEARVSISEYCLSMILKGHVVAPISSEQLVILRDLAGMANNLNQVVKKMHQEGQIKASFTVLDTIKKIEELLP